MTLAPGEGMGDQVQHEAGRRPRLLVDGEREACFCDLHGDPDVKPAGKEGTDYFESYELDDKTGKDQSHATFVAPSTGIHGWFSENKTDKDVTLKLVSAGFYDWSHAEPQGQANRAETYPYRSAFAGPPEDSRTKPSPLACRAHHPVRALREPLLQSGRQLEIRLGQQRVTD